MTSHRKCTRSLIIQNFFPGAAPRSDASEPMKKDTAQILRSQLNFETCLITRYTGIDLTATLFNDMGPDYFPVSLKGMVKVEHSEVFTFSVCCDDDTLLYRNGVLLLDHWYSRISPIIVKAVPQLFTSDAGTFTNQASVVVTCTEPGCTIHCILNSQMVTTGTPICTEAVKVTLSGTVVQPIAVGQGKTPSVMTSAPAASILESPEPVFSANGTTWVAAMALVAALVSSAALGRVNCATGRRKRGATTLMTLAAASLFFSPSKDSINI